MSEEDVKHLFSMDRERFVSYLGQLRAMDKSAAHLLSGLNARLSVPDRSDWSLNTGLIMAVLSLGLWRAAKAFGLAGPVEVFLVMVAAAGGATGLWRIQRGLRKKGRRSELRQEARDAQETLEGQGGFLWRFEPMLQDWDHNLPPEVRASLPSICAASKEGSLGDSLEDLRTYWYWASACEGRMNVAKAEMRW